MRQERPQVALGHIMYVCVCVSSIRVQATQVEFKQNRWVVWVAVGCGYCGRNCHSHGYFADASSYIGAHLSVSLHRQPLLKIWSTHAESWSATSCQNAPRKIHGKDRSRFLGPWRHDSQANHKKSDFRASLASKKQIKQERFTLEAVRINHGWKYALISESLLWFDRNLKALSDHLFIFLQTSSCNGNIMSSCWARSLLLLSKSLWIHPYSVVYYAHVSGTSCRSSHRLEPESRHKCTAWRKLGLSPVTNAWGKMVKRQENHCMPHHIKTGME